MHKTITQSWVAPVAKESGLLEKEAIQEILVYTLYPSVSPCAAISIGITITALHLWEYNSFLLASDDYTSLTAEKKLVAVSGLEKAW